MYRSYDRDSSRDRLGLKDTVKERSVSTTRDRSESRDRNGYTSSYLSPGTVTRPSSLRSESTNRLYNGYTTNNKDSDSNKESDTSPSTPKASLYRRSLSSSVTNVTNPSTENTRIRDRSYTRGVSDDNSRDTEPSSPLKPPETRFGRTTSTSSTGFDRSPSSTRPPWKRSNDESTSNTLDAFLKNVQTDTAVRKPLYAPPSNSGNSRKVSTDTVSENVSTTSKPPPASGVNSRKVSADNSTVEQRPTARKLSADVAGTNRVRKLTSAAYGRFAQEPEPNKCGPLSKCLKTPPKTPEVIEEKQETPSVNNISKRIECFENGIGTSETSSEENDPDAGKIEMVDRPTSPGMTVRTAETFPAFKRSKSSHKSNCDKNIQTVSEKETCRKISEETKTVRKISEDTKPVKKN